MINKIYKRINNRYLKFFNFFFFLRYVLLIFLTAIISYISIPKFLNYEKKIKNIEEYLINYYDLELNGYSSIKYEIFPLPNLSIKDTNLRVKNQPISFITKNFRIFLRIKDIYNFDNLVGKKILLDGNKIILDIEKTKNFLIYFIQLKNKLDIQNLNLNLKRQENSVLNINDTYFSNYGYKKNKIRGEIFDKKFEAHIDSDNRNLEFKILHTGIKAIFNLDGENENDITSGSLRINILNNYLKSKFLIRYNEIEIIKANLRNKDLSIFFDSSIKVNPFFEVNSDININKINKKLINNLSLEKIFKNVEILKKFNSNNKVTYNARRSFSNLIKSHYSELNLAHGRLVFLNKTLISGGVINCTGNSLLIEEYPRIKFDCLIDIKDKREFLKKFSISEKPNENTLYLNIVGSLNLFNKKINFSNININKKVNIVKGEDLKYFKETFENILFDDSFLNIFRKDKIKNFLLEII